MEQEGVIKYKMNWDKLSAPPAFDISDLVNYRNKCFDYQWIGYYDQFKVGYGNISLRFQKKKQFFISGSQTGHLPILEASQFSFIKKYNIELNALECIGAVKASSESLTHAAIYELSNNIDAIIHIHNKFLWEKYMHKLPTTDPNVEYGTPAMAAEVHRLFKSDKLNETGLLIMGGHEDGIISWGKSFDSAFKLLEKL